VRKSERPRAQIHAREGLRGQSSLVSAETEADDGRQRVVLVEVEDAAGGVGTPLTDGVEQDAAARPARFGLPRRRRQSPRGTRRREDRLPEDLRRDVDLGVGEAVPSEIGGHGPARFEVVLGSAEEPADLRIEAEEAILVADPRAFRFEDTGGFVTVAGGGREPADRLLRQTTLEVEVTVGEHSP
jgi:hypothetical protein